MFKDNFLKKLSFRFVGNPAGETGFRAVESGRAYKRAPGGERAIREGMGQEQPQEKFSISSIPESLEVETTVIRAKTGKPIKVKTNARQAYADALADIETLETAMRNCL